MVLTVQQEMLLKTICEQGNKAFKRLLTSAEKQLDDVMRINQETIEIDEELGTLSVNLSNSSAEATRSIEDTRSSLSSRERELQTIIKRKEECQETVERMNRKLEKNEDGRDVLRVVCKTIFDISNETVTYSRLASLLGRVLLSSLLSLAPLYLWKLAICELQSSSQPPD
jgi:seryl-tRNA synthetase